MLAGDGSGDLRRVVVRLLEGQSFRVGRGKLLEGSSASVEILYFRRAGDVGDLRFRIRPFALPASTAEGTLEAAREAFVRLREDANPGVRAAAVESLARLDAPRLGADALAGCQITLQFEGEPEPVSVQTTPDGSAVFQGVRAGVPCRVVAVRFAGVESSAAVDRPSEDAGPRGGTLSDPAASAWIVGTIQAKMRPLNTCAAAAPRAADEKQQPPTRSAAYSHKRLPFGELTTGVVADPRDGRWLSFGLRRSDNETTPVTVRFRLASQGQQSRTYEWVLPQLSGPVFRRDERLAELWPGVVSQDVHVELLDVVPSLPFPGGGPEESDDFESLIRRWWDDSFTWGAFVRLCRDAASRSPEGESEGPKKLPALEEHLAQGFPPSLHPIGSPAFVSYWPIMTQVYVACTRALVEPGPGVRWAALAEQVRARLPDGPVARALIVGPLLRDVGHALLNREAPQRLLAPPTVLGVLLVDQLAQETGETAQLTLELVGRAEGEDWGPATIYPHPDQHATSLEEAFLNSTQDALKAATGLFEAPPRVEADVRWRLMPWQGSPFTGLSGHSAGGAFGLGIAQQFARLLSGEG